MASMRKSAKVGTPRPDRLTSVNQATKEALPLARVSPPEQLLKWLKERTSKEDKKPAEGQKVSTLALLSYSTTTERFLMAFGLLMALVSGLGLPAWLVLLAKSLDKFSNLAFLITIIGGAGLQQKLQEELNNLVIAFVIVGCVCLVTGTLYVSIWTYTGEKQALRIKEKFVRSALQQDAAWFDTHNREEMPTSIASSMVQINGSIGRAMADTFANLFAAAGCLAVALMLNAPLTIVMLCVVPVVAVCIAILSCFVRKNSHEAAAEFSKAGAIATEVISGMKTVASLCAQLWALNNYKAFVLGSQKLSIRSSVLASLATGITGFLFYCTYTVAFVIGTEQVAGDATMVKIIQCIFDDDPNCRVTGSSVMCAIYGVILCATFFGLMAPGIQAINLGRQAAVDVFDVINRDPPIDASSTESGLTPKSFEGGLELRKVFFNYPSRPHVPIFYNFCLSIKPGESMALVGPSGSGKSTIAKLLLRFYDPQSGDVLVDGISLKDINVEWWRNQIGYVAQQPTLFPGTIKENIAKGKPGGATDEEVIAAAQAASAHEFIMNLPDGYETFYSGASIQLSGGEMQRIVIARAIIRNPSVLLLDEATSALDSNSEGQVQAALAKLRKIKQVTTVTVAHRLSTIISCDQIAVISNGSIAELGTHRSLFESNGIYTTLCESQGITADSSAAEATTSQKDASDGPDNGLSSPADNADLEAGVDSKGPKKLEPDDLEEEELAPMSRLWKYTKSDWPYLMLGILGAGIAGALSPCEAILTAQIVANYYVVDADQMADANLPYTLGFLALAGGALFGNLMSGVGFSVSGYRLTTRMRVLAFGSIVRRDMGWFDFPEHSTGELTTRLATDAELVSNVVGWQLGFKVRMISSLVTGIIIALVFSWQVGLVALLCVPFIMGAGIVQGLCLSKRYVEEDEGLPPATILEQGLRGIDAVQAYNLQTQVADSYDEALKPESRGKTKQGIYAGLAFGFSQFAVFVSFAILFWVGSKLLVEVKVDFVGFFTSILSVMFGALGMAQVNADFKAKQDGQAAAARIFAITDAPLDNSDPFSDKGEKPSSLDGAISFESCCFHYPTRPNHEIYYKSEEKDGFSLAIAAKQTMAFVGKSGCGKSTALQLVLRFYEVSDGKVRVDDCNVEDLNIGWLREQIGYVGQQPVLFSGTVRSNILLGKPDATEEEIIKAAKAADAHDFVMELGDGYDTDIGTGGSLLSGGQKQRIAIARAIVKDPKILVLDEATSALDNVSEREVQAALDSLQESQPRTTLVVAHRLTTVKNCDQIAVLGGGGVQELGSHSELLSQKGLYHELWMKQGADEKDNA